MSIQPRGSMVLVKVDEVATEVGGIYVPTNNTPINRGTIKKAGIAALALVTDDKVIFRPGTGFSVTEDNVDYLLIDASDILATIE